MRLAILAAAVALVPWGVAASGDASRGEQLYARCAACHDLAYDRVGPRHCGLLGRRAGAIAGFDYSVAMSKSGIIWSAGTLDQFLAAPTRMLPGTTMTYAGVDRQEDRADLIAFLASVRCETR